MKRAAAPKGHKRDQSRHIRALQDAASEENQDPGEE